MFRSSLFCLLIVSLLTLTSSAADGPNLDIAGIKIGMEPKAAIAALKAANPKGNLMTNSAQLQGFTKPVEPTIVSDQTASAENDGEKIELLLTLPPNQQRFGASLVPIITSTKTVHHWKTRWPPCVRNTGPKVCLPLLTRGIGPRA